MENHQRKETVNVEQYTIEHVMPQNEQLDDAWRTELGGDWQEVHAKYLHTIGNLTLTGYNPELSDRPFREKRDMSGGFRDSPIRLNGSLANVDRWNEAAIVARANDLIELACRIWSAPSLPEEQLQRYAQEDLLAPTGKYSLDDYPHLTGEILDLYGALRPRIMSLDPSVTEVFNKNYIAYKSSTNFVDIVPRKQRLDLTLNMRFVEVDDPRGLCRDVTGLDRWGNGDVEVAMPSGEQLEYIMDLIRQAFNKQVELDDG